MVKSRGSFQRAIALVGAFVGAVIMSSGPVSSAYLQDDDYDNVKYHGAPQQAPVSDTPLVIVSKDGTKHSFTTELALTAEDQAWGMMYRKVLADDVGMLFPLNRPRIASFWMKNVPIPLDIIYISTSGRVTNIVTAQPYDETPQFSRGYVAYVFEVRGGLAKELGIKAGDKVSHPLVNGGS